MNRYRLTKKARADLRSILDYIAADNPTAAYRVETAILDACEFLVTQPKAGRRRPELTLRKLRFWVVQSFPNYLIASRSSADLIDVIRIVHGARNPRREFR